MICDNNSNSNNNNDNNNNNNNNTDFICVCVHTVTQNVLCLPKVSWESHNKSDEMDGKSIG